jgi:hypothetical protein
MARVHLPDGCRALSMADPRRYTACPGDIVTVSAEHAARIRSAPRSTRGEAYTLGTKTGRVCDVCMRVWNVWNLLCPRCAAPTIPDGA